MYIQTAEQETQLNLNIADSDNDQDTETIPRKVLEDNLQDQFAVEAQYRYPTINRRI